MKTDPGFPFYLRLPWRSSKHWLETIRRVKNVLNVAKNHRCLIFPPWDYEIPDFRQAFKSSATKEYLGYPMEYLLSTTLDRISFNPNNRIAYRLLVLRGSLDCFGHLYNQCCFKTSGHFSSHHFLTAPMNRLLWCTRRGLTPLNTLLLEKRSKNRQSSTDLTLAC